MQFRKIPLPVRVILLYLFFGGLWITLSDRLLASLVSNITLLTRLQTYKGWFFVIASATLVFILLKRESLPREQAQEKYKKIFDEATEGIFQSTPDGKYLAVNPAMARIYGYGSSDEMISSITNIPEQIYVDRNERDIFVSRLASDGILKDFKARNHRKDGSIIWTSTNARAVHDHDGRLLYFEGFTQDITDRKLAETALRESEARYRDLVEHSPDAIAIHSDGLFEYINPAGLELIGAKSEQELIGTPFLEIISPDSKALVIEGLKTIEQGQNLPPIEEKIVCLDGRVIDVEISAMVLNYHGKPATQVIIRDITPRKKNEQELRFSEERFSTVFHASPIATCITTLLNGKFLDANQAYLSLLEIEQGDVIGRTIYDLKIFNDERSRLEIIKILERGEAVRGYEIPVITATGKRRDTLAFFEQIELRGEPCILSMFYDITEAMQISEALRNSEASYRGLFNSVSDAIYIQDKDGTFLDVNEGAAKMYGYPREYFIEKDLSILSAPGKNDLGKIIEYISKAFKGHPQHFEFWGKRANGEVFPKDVRLYRGNYLGQEVVIAVAQDITERKKIEAAIKRRLDELMILHEVALAGTQATNIDDLIKNVTNIVIKKLYPDNFGVFVYDQRLEILTPHPSYYGNLSSDLPLSLKRSDGIAGYVATTHRSYRTSDVRNDPLYFEADADTLSEISIPIVIEDCLFGVLNAESRQVDFFSDADEQLLITIAGTLAVSIQKLELLSLEKSRRREAETLNEAAAIISTSLEIEEVLDAILISVQRVIPYDSASIFLLEGDKTKIVAGIGFPGLKDELNKLVVRESELFDQIKQTGEIIIISNTTEDSRFIEWTEDEPIILSWMGVPLIARGDVIGFLTLDSHQINTYNRSLALIAQTFAYQAAAAISNAKSFENEQIRRQESEIIRSAATTISSYLDIDQVLETILTSIRQVVPYDSASVFLIKGKKLHLVASRDVPENANVIGKSLPISNELFAHIKQTGQTLIIDDTKFDSRFEPWKNVDYIRGWMGVPLITRNMVIGYISLDSKQVSAYDAHSARLAEAFAHQAAATIENARLYSEAKQSLFEMESIYRISSSLRVAETLEDMLPRLLEETLNLFNLTSGAIWLYETGNGQLTRTISKGWFTELTHINLTLGQGPIGRAYIQGKNQKLSEFNRDKEIDQADRNRIPSGSSGICIPIRAASETVGVITLSIEHPRKLSNQEINILNTISEIAGNAIHRASLHERTERQVRRLTALRDVDTAIASSFDLRVTLNILIDQIISQLDVDAADVMLFDPNLQTLTYSTSRGFRSAGISKMSLRIGEGLCGRVVLERKLVETNNIIANPQCTRKALYATEGFQVYYGVPLLAKGQIKGVLEIYNRTPLTPSPGWFEFLQTLAGQAAIAIDNAQLFDNLQKSNQDLAIAYDTTLEGWGNALELRDKDTEGHTQRVAKYTLRLAKVMGLSDMELTHVRRGVLLHDIGKMGIPDEILLKPGPLTEAEWEIMRQHPYYAYDLLYPIPYLRPALDIPLCHHERWDGSGYPRGLKGEEIPLPARIFAVVDVWDALLSDRPYREAQTPDITLQFIKDNSGKLFDPKIVELFLKIIDDDQDNSP